MGNLLRFATIFFNLHKNYFLYFYVVVLGLRDLLEYFLNFIIWVLFQPFDTFHKWNNFVNRRFIIFWLSCCLLKSTCSETYGTVPNGIYRTVHNVNRIRYKIVFDSKKYSISTAGISTLDIFFSTNRFCFNAF